MSLLASISPGPAAAGSTSLLRSCFRRPLAIFCSEQRWFGTPQSVDSGNMPPIDTASLSPEDLKLFRMLDHLPTKKQKQVETYLRTRQRVHKANAAQKESESVTRTQLVKRTPVIASLLQKIKDLGVGKGRQPRTRARRQRALQEVHVDPRERQQVESFFSSYKYTASAARMSSFPPPGRAEIAFIGRSNVGKSSLLNAVTCTHLAYTSDKPGQTQTINWFTKTTPGKLSALGTDTTPSSLHERAQARQGASSPFSSSSSILSRAKKVHVDEAELEEVARWTQASEELTKAGLHTALVDLPGYGFALASPERHENWQQLIRDYLSTRSTLKRVLLLVDARHGLKAADIEMMRTLDQSCKSSFQLVFTKCDLVEEEELAKRLYITQEDLRKHRIRKSKAGVLPLQKLIMSLFGARTLSLTLPPSPAMTKRTFLGSSATQRRSTTATRPSVSREKIGQRRGKPVRSRPGSIPRTRRSGEI